MPLERQRVSGHHKTGTESNKSSAETSTLISDSRRRYNEGIRLEVALSKRRFSEGWPDTSWHRISELLHDYRYGKDADARQKIETIVGQVSAVATAEVSAADIPLLKKIFEKQRGSRNRLETVCAVSDRNPVGL